MTSFGSRRPFPSRADLSNRSIAALVGMLAVLTLAFFSVRHLLPPEWSRPGSPELYSAGVAGAVLTLLPVAFAWVKRCGRSRSFSPPIWFCVHVLGGAAGVFVLLIHSAGNFGRAPALVLMLGTFLVLQGAWARIHISQTIPKVFGTRFEAIVGSPAVDREALRRVIDRKIAVLAELDPHASEALFSLTPRHWIGWPGQSLAYSRLASKERALIAEAMGNSVKPPLWRRLHLLAATAFVVGLAVHVAMVTFFAGYVAGGEEITWWHLAAWGG